MTIKICPPDKRGRDMDNVLGAWKYYQDGVFLALEMNDNKIRRAILEWGEVEKGGALYIELSLLGV